MCFSLDAAKIRVFSHFLDTINFQITARGRFKEAMGNFYPLPKTKKQNGNVVLTPLYTALPPYYRLKMRALLRAFTHFKFLFYFFCKKKIIPLVPKHANFTGTSVRSRTKLMPVPPKKIIKLV